MSNFKGIVRCKTKSDYDGLTKDSDKLYIVDEETPATMLIEGTYSQITSIAQQSQLTKGSLYKITDYVCVNDELGTGTTGMPVGIILTAVSSNKFSEQCMACSTTVNSVSTETFAQTNSLENFDITEFSIKYSINNDFDVTTTKGYIYSQCIQYGKGGGGGATTLGFDHINMHYVDEEDNLNGGVFSVGKGYKRYLLDEFKTTEDIFVEFVSTELPSEIEEKISQGRFAIRFDYPTKFHKRNTYATLPTGAGNRSFAHNLYSNGGDDNVERGSQIRRYMQLHNSFYFVTSSDIKTKEDGTKYLHIKISVKDLMNKMFVISTSKNDDGGEAYETNKLMDLTDLAKEYILDSYGGIPYVGGQMCFYTNSQELEFRSISNQRLFDTSSNAGLARRLGTHPKEDKLFNCLFMLMSEEDNAISSPTFSSQFFRGDKTLERQNSYDIDGSLGRFCFDDAGNINARAKQNMSVVVKPRFCVLKEDWETIGNDGNGGSMFEKKYEQSEQSIIVRIPDTLYYDNEIMVYLPVFRIIISRYYRK